MIKDIKFNGYTANPSDYECADGDLAMAMGLVQEDGAMRPVLPPSTVLSFSSGTSVLYIHVISNSNKHYILSSNGNLQWWNGENTSSPTTLLSFSSTIHQVTSIGNTLVVLASDGMHYFLWKGDNDDYLYLGSEIPECPLSFGLQGEMIRTDEFEISFDSINEDELWDELSDDNKMIISNQVLAKVNKFIADNSTNKGKFIYPFLLRYAYRLYDGSLTKHSAPILMIASSDLAPQVFWTHISGKGAYSSAKLQVVGVLHKIDFAAVSELHLSKLKNWNDIVRSVDVFISKPIYTYDQNGECSKFVKVDENDCFCVCKHTNQAVSEDVYPIRYQKHDFKSLYAFTFNPDTFEYPVSRLMLPKRSVDDVKSDIKNCSQFYFLESIKLDQISTERKIIPVEDDYLQSLVTREVMSDDYDSHDKIIPEYAFVYNNRLNVSNISKVLFSGHNANSLFSYSNGYVRNWDSLPPTGLDYTESIEIYVFIKQDGKDIIVKGESGSLGYQSPILYIFYPNSNAYKAVVIRSRPPFSNSYEILLEQHDFLNGAFYFGGWSDLSNELESPSPIESPLSARMIPLLNKIYTSEVNNPFAFPLLGINTVGTGEIKGISAAAKALSEGQFGQFPLYAFSTEGVWALEVSATGSYSAKQPITRDVVINPGSITQIDSAVLFATERGIMQISGSSVLCLSDSINSTKLFSIGNLPKSNELINTFNDKAADGQQIAFGDVVLLPFGEFLQNCRMIYDYTNQHIIVYNPAVRYAYIYTLKSNTWGMMRSDIVDSVNSYPEALAMTLDSKLVNFSKSDAEITASLIVTRPFKIDGLDTFKTINTIIQRGFFRPSNIQQILYGSNDLFHWFAVWSSVDKIMRGFRGSPYKYFRLALVCKLEKGESLYGCSLSYDPRARNQLR